MSVKFWKYRYGTFLFFLLYQPGVNAEHEWEKNQSKPTADLTRFNAAIAWFWESHE